MSNVADLWAVQNTELALEAIRQRLIDLQQQLAEPEALKTARQALAEADAALAESNSRRGVLDQQLAQVREHISSGERELMSGRVRNSRELEGMQANVDALQRRRGVLEEETLLAWSEAETLQQQQAACLAAFEQAQQAHQVRQAKIKHEAAHKIAEMNALNAKLQQQWQGISEADKQSYKTLRVRKGGRAIALEQNGACVACGIMLPTGLAQAVHHATQPVVCPGCGRLLLAKT
ncbi:MAG: C4-type zinc ribbon domain-containing protein [Caldilineales bacterium]